MTENMPVVTLLLTRSQLYRQSSFCTQYENTPLTVAAWTKVNLQGDSLRGMEKECSKVLGLHLLGLLMYWAMITRRGQDYCWIKKTIT